MIAIDTHTHSLASGHAYSSLEEMARACHGKGIPGFVLTDHSPGMPGGAHLYHFYNLKVLPRTIHGCHVFHGAEANIVSSDGEIDMDEEVLSCLDLVIASFHIPTFPPRGREEHTSALLGAMKNPHVKVIGHPDDERYPFDVPAVVRAAGETKTLLEMNNTSLSPWGFRVNARENCTALLKECRKQGVMITIGSDAHFSSRVGDSEFCEDLLKELDFPAELIANSTVERFLEVTGLKL